MKIVIIQTHPIQHFCPQFESYSKIEDIELFVIFDSDKGMKTYYDVEFRKEIKWNNLNLDRFKHCFLGNHPIESILNDQNPDMVIVYGYYETVQKRAYQWARANHKKVLYISDSTFHQHQSFIKKIVKKILYYRYFKGIDICLSVGDSNETMYRWYGVPDVKMIRTSFPIDRNHLNPKAENKESISRMVREKYQISPQTVVISTIGKLEKFKRQIDLVNAIKILESTLDAEVVVFIIGSGEEYQNLVDASTLLKKNRILFTGFVQPNEIPDFLCASDLYVHTSEREAHSLSISEAIYLGCSVILTDACGSYGPTDDVQPGKNGFVYQTGAIEQLASYIRFLATNKNILQQFSRESSIIGQYNQKLAHGEALKAAIHLMKLHEDIDYRL